MELHAAHRTEKPSWDDPQLMQQAAATLAEKALQPAWVQPAPGHPNVH